MKTIPTVEWRKGQRLSQGILQFTLHILMKSGRVVLLFRHQRRSATNIRHIRDENWRKCSHCCQPSWTRLPSCYLPRNSPSLPDELNAFRLSLLSAGLGTRRFSERSWSLSCNRTASACSIWVTQGGSTRSCLGSCHLKSSF